MDPKFLKPYDPAATEKDIYRKWEESGYFNPDNLPARHTKPWCNIMPPPNANGRLHAGHGLDMTLKDIATRFERMRGKKALFLPGADHAGFETQVVYEKKLEKEGRSRFGMDPRELYDEIYAFTIGNKKYMEDDVRRLGASCDWSREKFTLDPAIVVRVQETFVKMHQDGLAYRGKRIVNWCPKHQTSLSDVETAWADQNDPFYYFKYGPFVIATSRPETKFGDKYVVVNPKDERYKQYKHGQQFTAEWINGPITATVLHDPEQDMEFGTGAMTITPWHDAHDFDLAKKFDLPLGEQVIDWRGKLLPIAGEFAGMKILDARPKIVEKLAAKGLVERIDEKYVHATKHCYKCNSLIEPQVKDQWFVKMEPLAAMVVKAVEEEKRIRILPEYQERILLHWMKNTIDWNVSRQIVWGIPIPAWFRNRGTDEEEIVVSLEKPAGEGWEQDSDVFDTWFSSGQWPLLTLGFPDGKDFKEFYPTDLMETGTDLVFKWVPRMIMFGIYLAGKIPFTDVYFHGMVNDAANKKMSKSKGNVVSPIDMADKFGADALRMALVIGNPPGGSTPLSDDKMKAYKNFANKLWNIARFVLENGDMNADVTHHDIVEADKVLIAGFETLAADITKDIEAYRFYMAGEKLYHYIWDRFASEILEESKSIFKTGDERAAQSRRETLVHLFANALKLLHPFMPFVTEEIWQSMPPEPGQSERGLLMIAPWPIG